MDAIKEVVYGRQDMMNANSGMIAGCVAAAAVVVGPATGRAAAQTETNTVWEHVLTSTREYDNPYADVSVRVTYTGPRGQTLDTFGFWDGGDTFRVRANFRIPGEWTWSTTCSDPSNRGLHGQSGTVTVKPYGGGNELYRRGGLAVSDNRRYLTYADGTPFLWVGDTAWVAPLRASQSDWEIYVDDRSAKGFSVIQLSPASAWGGTRDVEGNRPFIGDGLAQWNPAYWRGFEDKVRYANDRGLVVLLAGVMAPVSEEPGAYPDPSELERFARNIAGRLAGSHVVFSPSFDAEGDANVALGNDVGGVLREAVVNQLVTEHPGTNLETLRAWNGQPYMDFVGVQTGHNRRNFERVFGQAVHWVRECYEREPIKPVINLEALYAADGTDRDDQTNTHGSAADARHTAYLSILSGSTSGITYGARGVWGWETDPDKQWYWRDAIEYPSATQMGRLHDFFSNIEWWELAPASDLVASNESIRENALLRAFAMSEGGDLGVGYIPPGAADMTLDMSGFAGEVTGRWFNPQTGEYVGIPGKRGNAGVETFTRPGGRGWDDAVLLLGAEPRA